MSTLSLLFLVLPLGGQPEADSLPTAAQMRQVVERSLPYMLKAGLSWKERIFAAKKIHCISCHHIPLAVWTHREAQTQGFAVDQQQLDLLTDWMIDFSAAERYPDELVDGFLETVMLASETTNRPMQRGEVFEKFLEKLAKQQRPDGSWLRQDSPNEPGFAIVPPAAKDDVAAKREANEVDTMWALLGIDAFERLGPTWSPQTRELLTELRSPAIAFLKESKGSSRNDWLAFRYLVERELEKETTAGGTATRWRQALLDQQNRDGGWGLVRSDPSHPLVTGQVLYALGSAGVGDDETAVRRAWKYLSKTQRGNGSWPATSRPLADHRNDITENFGTGWAILGILQTLPAPNKPD